MMIDSQKNQITLYTVADIVKTLLFCTTTPFDVSDTATPQYANSVVPYASVMNIPVLHLSDLETNTMYVPAPLSTGTVIDDCAETVCPYATVLKTINLLFNGSLSVYMVRWYKNLLKG